MRAQVASVKFSNLNFIILQAEITEEETKEKNAHTGTRNNELFKRKSIKTYKNLHINFN